MLTAFALWIHIKSAGSIDYMAGSSGVVVDSTGVPIPEAAITIKYAKTVFSVIDPVRVGHTSSDKAGRFNIWFISCGDSQTPFELSVAKNGFHTIRLRGAGFEKHDRPSGTG